MYPKPIPRDLSQDFSIFPDRIPVGFYPWSRSHLGPAYARIAEASTSFPVPQRAPIREDVCLPCVCQTPPGGPDRVFPASRPSRGVVSCVALGLPGHPPKRAVPRYPPRGVLRDWSRPVPGLCRGVVSPLTGGFPHRYPRCSCRRYLMKQVYLPPRSVDLRRGIPPMGFTNRLLITAKNKLIETALSVIPLG